MNPVELEQADRVARFLSNEEIDHLGLEAPRAFIEVIRNQTGFDSGVYVIQRNGEFVPFKEASTLEGLLEFLSFGRPVVSTGESFQVQAKNLIICTRADGCVVSYDLYRDNRF